LRFRNQRVPITDADKADFAQHKARFDAEFERYAQPSREQIASAREKAVDTKKDPLVLEVIMPVPQLVPSGTGDRLNGHGRLPH
jgi:hypothetical protein